MHGHYTPSVYSVTNEIWGLCLNPADKDEYITCSDDGTVRVWSASEKKVKRQARIDLDGSGKTLPKKKEDKGDL